MAEPIRVLIADDEPGMRMILQKIVTREEGFEICGEAKDGPDLIAQFEEKRPQVCFLDVEMPGLGGIECAKLIQDMAPRTILIFATAHDDYMAQAFELYAFDYLVKPFKIERVTQTLKRIREVIDSQTGQKTEKRPAVQSDPAERTGGQTERIMLHHKDGITFVSQKDILLIQRENRATVLYATENRRFETSESLGEVEARLDKKHFFRCHKSYIINLDAIDTITPYGRWTYVVHLTGTSQDALITHEKYEELEKMFS